MKRQFTTWFMALLLAIFIAGCSSSEPSQVYTLNVTNTGGGTVTSSPAGIDCGSTCSASFTSGTSVSLSATANSDYTFSGWSGACTGTGTCTVSMSAARSVMAGFTTQRGDLVSITSTLTLAIAEIDSNISMLTSTYKIITTPLIADRRYQVSLQRIVYKTVTPDGRLIDASGLMAYPLKPDGVSSPILSYQHETILLDAQAPTSPNLGLARDAALLVAMAGSGFIVTMPDYIGYGSSANEMHTYMHAQGLATATVDMLRAARQVLTNNNIATNGQLFLTGFSEGAYATLATQKEIQENLSAEFTVTASMPAAGPYDMSGWVRYFIEQDSYPFQVLPGFVFVAYDRWYEWNRLNDIYRQVFDPNVASFFDGTRSFNDFPGMANSETLYGTAFRPDFRGDGEIAIKTDIAQNDIYDWSPLAPTRLVHGQGDFLVPYSNSTRALDAMMRAGSTSVTLEDLSCPDEANFHTECVADYLTRAISWFTSLAQDL